MESLRPSSRRYHHRRIEVYTRVDENLSPFGVKWLDSNIHRNYESLPLSYLLKQRKQHGNGQKLVNTSDDLPMEKGAMLNNCGKW